MILIGGLNNIIGGTLLRRQRMHRGNWLQTGKCIHWMMPAHKSAYSKNGRTRSGFWLGSNVPMPPRTFSGSAAPTSDVGVGRGFNSLLWHQPSLGAQRRAKAGRIHTVHGAPSYGSASQPKLARSGTKGEGCPAGVIILACQTLLDLSAAKRLNTRVRQYSCLRNSKACFPTILE